MNNSKEAILKEIFDADLLPGHWDDFKVTHPLTAESILKALDQHAQVKAREAADAAWDAAIRYYRAVNNDDWGVDDKESYLQTNFPINKKEK